LEFFLMSEQHTNALAQAASAYLRSASKQPVAWHEWGDEAFAKARRENKPVLLDIGAVWCHWCHVMDRESYENAEMAALINERFIAVKVDRDERPDVDSRYQAAVAAISGQGGWPLTAFLTPEGKPYFGGGYFPLEERYGRPSFQRVLLTMSDAFAHQRADVDETAGGVLEAIEQNETFSGRAGEPGVELLAKIVESALSQFDAKNGGFGAEPKFPNAGAIDLLIDAAGRGGDQAAKAKHVATYTLTKMAAGGIFDQLAGGFHRYSVDERWVVPHFEKMAYDNSELLETYAHAYQSFAQPEFAAVAREVLRWMDEWLSDREHGGFYASQDADDSLEDDGDYFTWTRSEAAEVLLPDELGVAAAFYNLRPVGDMHHNPQKNVLHRVATVEQISAASKVDVETIAALLSSAQKKMYAARLGRRTPYVDKTMYTGWNGMCISAYLAAGRVLNRPEAVAFALKSLDRVLSAAWDESLGLAHVVAYGDGAEGKRVTGVLEDYTFLATAALDAWEVTGELRYFNIAQKLAELMLDRFCDEEANGTTSAGFFDTEKGAEGIGALVTKRKPLQDSPSPAGNGLAATVLLRLHALTGVTRYQRRAMETLETFAGVVEHFGLYVASYAAALRYAIDGPVQVCVIGDDAAADELMVAALMRYAVNKSVVRLRWEQLEALPPVLAETLPHLQAGTSVAVICKGSQCLPAVSTPEALIGALM
jgi:uncharacterized protein YyaL (SSP411 family)